MFSEIEDVVSSIHVDRDQVSVVWNQALVTALQTTPVKQFGIGFGVGWCVCLFVCVCVCVCFRLYVCVCVFECVETEMYSAGCQGICSEESAEQLHSLLAVGSLQYRYTL